MNKTHEERFFEIKKAIRDYEFYMNYKPEGEAKEQTFKCAPTSQDYWDMKELLESLENSSVSQTHTISSLLERVEKLEKKLRQPTGYWDPVSPSTPSVAPAVQEKPEIDFQSIPQDKDRGIFKVRAYQTDETFGYDRWVADQYSLGKGTHDALLIVFNHNEKGAKLAD